MTAAHFRHPPVMSSPRLFEGGRTLRHNGLTCVRVTERCRVSGYSSAGQARGNCERRGRNVRSIRAVSMPLSYFARGYSLRSVVWLNLRRRRALTRVRPSRDGWQKRRVSWDYRIG